MEKFIELTMRSSLKRVSIKESSIIAFAEGAEGTVIEYGSSTPFTVTESYDEVKKLITPQLRGIRASKVL